MESDVLIRKGGIGRSLQSFQAGSCLDDVFTYGPGLLFSEIALDVCVKEKVYLRFNCLDTSSFSLTGEYLPDTDEQAVRITYGYSKDHRPDLKQAVLELMVAQDVGVPFMSKTWDGNASDNAVFESRSKDL